MKKWLLRISTGLFGVGFLLLGGFFFLLGTQSGTDLLLSQAKKQLDGRLHIASATGSLLDRLEVTGLLVDSPAGKTELDRLVLDWKSSDLLRLHFHIVEFSVDELSHTARPQAVEERPESTAPLTLPDLDLPVTISIDTLRVTNLVYLAADAEPLTVENALLTLLWDATGIQLQKLTITMAEGELQAQGQLLPTGNYPLQLSTDISTLSPDYPTLTLHGQYDGDLQKLALTQTLRGDIEADLQGTFRDILQTPSWDLELQLLQLLPQTFAPEMPGMVSGGIRSTGTLQQLGVTARLTMRDEKAEQANWEAILDLDLSLESLLLHINKCHIQHLHTPASLALTGKADMEKQLDVMLKWHDLQWPITDEADYQSPAGEMQLTGTVDDFRLLLNSSVSGRKIPETKIAVVTSGDTEHVHDIQLSLETLGGNIAVTGDVSWAPAVRWQLRTEAQYLNPGTYFSDWPGTVNWLLTTDGRLEDSGFFANLDIGHVRGTLRAFPIAGTGTVALESDSIRIDKLQLSSGNAVVSAQGVLGETSELQWDINIQDFANLFPDSSGQLTGSGTVHGKMTTPRITAQLLGNDINTPPLRLRQIQAEADLDLSWQKAFRFSLIAEDLQSGENQVQNITLQSDGLLARHRGKLSASHELADLSLAFQGGYDEEQWHGVVENLLLDVKDMGEWETINPVQLSAGAKGATLNTLCLSRKKTDLCMDGTWDAPSNYSAGKIALTDFPLNWLSAWFPETLETLGGTFSLQADATMQDTLKADLHGIITPGEISYVTDTQEGQLSHEGVKVDLQLADDGLAADLWLSVDSNIISGTLNSPSLLARTEKTSPTLDGRIHIDAKNFKLVETMVPDVQQLQAQIDSDLRIRGTLAEPQINGNGKLHVSYILIPMVGLELTDTTLDILADNDQLKIDGTFNSPKGSMAIQGEALIDAAENYPAHISLKGENFRLINRPDMQVYITSDLLLEKKKDLSTLTGEITIPRAEVLLRDLPQGTKTASPDVIIVQEEKAEEPKSPLQMKLRVKLGNRVHFAGMGVNAFIDGQLYLTAEPEEQMLGSGEFHIKQGSYRRYGQDLDIETGIISFPGGPLTQPGINLRAVRTVGDVVAGIYAIGPARKPRITTFARPPMSESQTIAYLITGSAPNNMGEGTTFSVGRQINSKLSVSAGTNTKTGESEFVTRYRLNRNIHVQTTTATTGNAADIFYTMELGGEGKETKQAAAKK